MNNQQKIYLTEEQRKQRKERLDNLINVEIPKNSQDIEFAKAQGDLSENAEYDAAKDAQAKLYAEKAKLEYILTNAIIIKQNESNESVEIGHAITIEWDFGKVETVTLLGYGDPKNGEISIDSPLGKAVLGKKVDEVAVVDAPKGRFNVKILAIT